MNVGPVRPQDVTTKPVLIQRPTKDSTRPQVASVDHADFSESTRTVVQEAERQAARLRGPDLERQQIVEAARGKLARGELDDLHVLRQTARRLLELNEGM